MKIITGIDVYDPKIETFYLEKEDQDCAYVNKYVTYVESDPKYYKISCAVNAEGFHIWRSSIKEHEFRWGIHTIKKLEEYETLSKVYFPIKINQYIQQQTEYCKNAAILR